MAQYNTRAMIPVEEVCSDYFGHFDTREFFRRTAKGQLALPLVKIEAGQ